MKYIPFILFSLGILTMFVPLMLGKYYLDTFCIPGGALISCIGVFIGNLNPRLRDNDTDILDSYMTDEQVKSNESWRTLVNSIEDTMKPEDVFNILKDYKFPKKW